MYRLCRNTGRLSIRLCLVALFVTVMSGCTSSEADGPQEGDSTAGALPTPQEISDGIDRPTPTPIVARVLPTSTSVPTPVPTPTPDPRLADAVEVATTYYSLGVEALDDPLEANILDRIAFEHVDGSARGVAMQTLTFAVDGNVSVSSEGAQLEVLGDPFFTSYDGIEGFERDPIIAVEMCFEGPNEWRDLDTGEVIFESVDYPFTVTVWIEPVDGLVWGLTEDVERLCKFSP